tara:strand:- start:1021 stop:1272 length:252 start_codon:yes stop_codon:yes gene_type:complete
MIDDEWVGAHRNLTPAAQKTVKSGQRLKLHRNYRFAVLLEHHLKTLAKKLKKMSFERVMKRILITTIATVFLVACKATMFLIG